MEVPYPMQYYLMQCDHLRCERSFSQRTIKLVTGDLLFSESVIKNNTFTAYLLHYEFRNIFEIIFGGGWGPTYGGVLLRATAPGFERLL